MGAMPEAPFRNWLNFNHVLDLLQLVRVNGLAKQRSVFAIPRSAYG